MDEIVICRVFPYKFDPEALDCAYINAAGELSFIAKPCIVLSREEIAKEYPSK